MGETVVPFRRPPPAPPPRKPSRPSKKRERDIIFAVIEEHAEYMCSDGKAMRRLGERVEHSGERILTLLGELKGLV